MPQAASENVEKGSATCLARKLVKIIKNRSVLICEVAVQGFAAEYGRNVLPKKLLLMFIKSESIMGAGFSLMSYVHSKKDLLQFWLDKPKQIRK